MEQIIRKNVTLPLNPDIIKGLRAGDALLLTGYLYTARDAAHKKLVEMIENDKELPINIAGETIYYAGPCPSKPGEIIGSAGPTTSGRMDKYAPILLQKGLLGMIGKGARTNQVVDAMKTAGAVYLGATGGAGALIAQCVQSAQVVAFPELGTEAVRRIYVENFPVIVLIDVEGNNQYEIGREKYKK